jgi:hypothetical protein
MLFKAILLFLCLLFELLRYNWFDDYLQAVIDALEDSMAKFVFSLLLTESFHGVEDTSLIVIFRLRFRTVLLRIETMCHRFSVWARIKTTTLLIFFIFFILLSDYIVTHVYIIEIGLEINLCLVGIGIGLALRLDLALKFGFQFVVSPDIGCLCHR